MTSYAPYGKMSFFLAEVFSLSFSLCEISSYSSEGLGDASQRIMLYVRIESRTLVSSTVTD